MIFEALRALGVPVQKHYVMLGPEEASVYEVMNPFVADCAFCGQYSLFHQLLGDAILEQFGFCLGEDIAFNRETRCEWFGTTIILRS